MKRYWTVLFTIIISAFLLQIMTRFTPKGLKFLLDLLWFTILILVGYSMAPSTKKNNRWLGKVVLSLLIIFIVAYRMNWIIFPQLSNLLNSIGLGAGFLDLLLVYCGWAFFQV